MDNYEIILKRLDEIREDIRNIFKKLDENEEEIFCLKQSLSINEVKFQKDINGLKDCYNDIKKRPQELREAIKFFLYVLSTLFGNGIIILILKLAGVIK